MISTQNCEQFVVVHGSASNVLIGDKKGSGKIREAAMYCWKVISYGPP